MLHRQQLEEPVGRDGGMTWIGDNSIEIGAPYGEGSSVATFVERLGGGMHSVAVQVDDLAATLDPARTARRRGRRAHRAGYRVHADPVEPRDSCSSGASHVQDDDPRFGAPVPPFVTEPVVNVERMAFVAAHRARPGG